MEKGGRRQKSLLGLCVLDGHINMQKTKIEHLRFILLLEPSASPKQKPTLHLK